jgi:uncharacterized protein YkwD
VCPDRGPETSRRFASYHDALHLHRFASSTLHLARPAPLSLAFVLAVGVLVAPGRAAAPPAFAAAQPAAATGSAAADLGSAAAESSLVAMINADRAAVGLPPLRLDARLSAIAHERSVSMAAAGQLSHVQPDGRSVVDIIKAAGIAWYGVGETIGWNNYPGLRDSTNVVNRGWLGSPEHAAIIHSKDYNYFGVGLGMTASGDRYWTAVFLRGPDRTAPWAKMLAPTSGSYVILASRRKVRLVTWSWTGDDRPLAVLTSGLRSFEVQRRVDGGAWTSVWASTTRRAWSSSVWVGHRVQVRVRALDNAGNVGAWSSPVSVSA